MSSNVDNTGMEHSFYLSQTEPTRDPAALNVWWGLHIDVSYNPFKVEFLSREVITNGPLPRDCLNFKLVHDPDGPSLEVDLKDATEQAWPYFPSTIPTSAEIESAHNSGERIYGFLFLSDTWISIEHQRPDGRYKEGDEKLDLRRNVSGGGKWPLAGSAPLIPEKETR
ncbi:hypothetical protein [Myxococcus hansupus]|uniref:hypothetical protein n=1 Tax=Pseudomyxococcus hansupus TaxID=1297742 RepID=UPI0011875C17|nr:hypothetical protein [Myxococcus hansupus]